MSACLTQPARSSWSRYGRRRTAWTRQSLTPRHSSTCMVRRRCGRASVGVVTVVLLLLLDTNGDGALDAMEIEALFYGEVS